jgi:hypothetical protein
MKNVVIKNIVDLWRLNPRVRIGSPDHVVAHLYSLHGDSVRKSLAKELAQDGDEIFCITDD